MIHAGLRFLEATNDVSASSSAGTEQPGSMNAQFPASSHTTQQRVWKVLNVKCSMLIMNFSFKTHKFTVNFTRFANYYGKMHRNNVKKIPDQVRNDVQE